MWYTRGNGIEYTSSTDGINWSEGILVMPDESYGNWDERTRPKAIYYDGTTYTLFYQGVDSEGWFQGGVVEFTDSRTQYIRQRSEPILPRDEQGSTPIIAIDETKTLIQVENHQAFSQGEYILLLGASGYWEANQILSKLDEDWLELSEPIQGNPTYLRSYMFSKVYPRHVWKEGNTWHILGTCFDQARGIASTGIEFTFKASGNSLDTLVWDKFLPPPFGIPNSEPDQWNSLSIENPTVVEF